MKNDLLRKLLSAGRLTGRGRLMQATASIQRALAQSATSAATAQRAATAMAGTLARARQPEVRSDAGTAVVDAPPAQAGFTRSSFTGASGTREFKLFVPAGRDGDALPLVVMLHGCTQGPDDFATGTRMNALAERAGVCVLYPEQAARSNAHRCWNWFVPGDQQRGAGEPALIAGMTRHVMQAHAIDPARVYVAGLSAGGAMAAILAREYADLFAAAGIHSGLPAGAAHDVASAFTAMKSGVTAGRGAGGTMAPLIVFHGSADATVAAANGNAVIATALAAEIGAVPSEHSGRTASGRAWRRTVWHRREAEDAPSLAEHWQIDGAPHAWSGGSAAGSFTDPTGPDASAEMLRFFIEHARVPA
ncbi:MAG: PHB depolymerase family esterase [Caldimonas sp.]